MDNIGYKFLLEMQGTRLERTNKRMFVIIILLIVSLLVTNGCWFYYDSQFEQAQTTTIKAEQQADGDSNNYIIGGDYDSCNTESDDSQNKTESP